MYYSFQTHDRDLRRCTQIKKSSKSLLDFNRKSVPELFTVWKCLSLIKTADLLVLKFMFSKVSQLFSIIKLLMFMSINCFDKFMKSNLFFQKLKKQRDQLQQYQRRIEGVLDKDRQLAKKLLNEGKRE